MARRRSLLKDTADYNAFRHHRDRHLGFCVSNEYYQQTPFFFTRECAQLNLVGQYKGASAFLILNGPSLVSGDYDLSLLKSPGVITYGVNNGPATFRPTFWSCVDDPHRFLKSIWLDPAITKFVPHAHAEKSIFDNETWEVMKEDGKNILVGECPNCIYFHRNEKFEASRWLFEDKLNWGNSGQHGGGRSVMLPAMRILFLLGFRRVYLLGADFKMSESYTYHFDEQRAKGAVKGNNETYKKMAEEYFPSLKPLFDEEGFEVFNCTKDSGLKCFPYLSFNDAIKEATEKLGDVQNQRTYGMYVKTEEKGKFKDEVTNDQKPHLETLKNRDAVLAKMNGDNEQIKPNVVVSKDPVVKKTDVVKPETTSRNVKVYPTVEKVVETDKPVQVVIPRVVRQDSPEEKIPMEKISGEKKIIKKLPFKC